MHSQSPRVARWLMLASSLGFLATLAGTSVAQPAPADMVSGTVTALITPQAPPEIVTTPLMVVPAGKYFVLTDLEYSISWEDISGVDFHCPLVVLQGAVERWGTFLSGFRNTFTSPGQDARDMLRKSFSTGLVFPPGSTAQITHQPTQSGGAVQIPWRLSWTGYLAPTTTIGLRYPEPSNDLRLGNAAPNPADDETRITFNLGKTSRIKLRILDERGRVVRNLYAGPKPAGEHGLTWNVRDDRGKAVASGVYFIELLANGERQSRKAVVVN